LSNNFIGTTGAATLTCALIAVGANTVQVSTAGGITLANSTNTIPHTLAGWLGVATTVGVVKLSTRAAANQ
jgi:hypothetical protein